ncbi:uncharacterized protein HMPREF1541_10849 [Cyphellophora europaea CBS 101466]|uniref:Uncharacterized protein n=1 Tax=Cyphellophora europaea (strain CBS 101466) TaxID=1220924 RepID=W2S7U4_CYPE1|nr:uncharacterized protein HMPREF1541_10849 [Cyphellophora europaea CBS 101466]ETN43984.1 hypothetical protein HMPREF1541_10849 [Cyphellophora europaea CBS 101466]
MSNNKLLVLIGSGPGIGVATASLFASNGFNVALLSRSASRLESDAATIRSAAATPDIKIESLPCDASDAASLNSALEKVHATLGSPEVVIYNAARVGPSEFGQFTPEEMVQDYKLNSVGIYVAAMWALPYLAQIAEEGGKPGFFLSGSGIGWRPLPPFFSLCMQKAAQINFLQSFEYLAGPKGVHVARLDINGIVSPDDPETSPKVCAQQHWALYQQQKGQWDSVKQVGDMEAFAKKMGFP